MWNQQQVAGHVHDHRNRNQHCRNALPMQCQQGSRAWSAEKGEKQRYCQDLENEDAAAVAPWVEQADYRFGEQGQPTGQTEPEDDGRSNCNPQESPEL